MFFCPFNQLLHSCPAHLVYLNTKYQISYDLFPSKQNNQLFSELKLKRYSIKVIKLDILNLFLSKQCDIWLRNYD